ncbi:hypothetical protein HDV64DRAFT_287029 [Trichoderma sp. TUCIM 5745]
MEKSRPQTPTTNLQDIEEVFMRLTAGDKKLTREVHHALIKQYLREKDTWDSETLNNNIQKLITKDPTWTKFFFLRVMFGPRRCSTQSWFPNFSDKYPIAKANAPAGCVPTNYGELLTNKTPSDWDPYSPPFENTDYDAVKARQAVARRSKPTKKKHMKKKKHENFGLLVP